ncbi:GDP-L-fucose synthase family protein [Prochlorococcus marinus]|uniref:GDP-L-fucose synthase family protein n=1 Tax=Prochlorococcus marinus TaxID=1219 RepID=UPI001ADB9622|nr:GDP-L-fucose synthase [Prochlorococcus marinus]MBO8204926.1 GDP-L-fucose synthase [Prochlorococcus marinus CUG1415]MBW3044198.1 GDP-fucose synthetase [Prochlorococcus marinus str. MU1415]
MFVLNENSKIYVAGSTGMVGSAICRLLNRYGINSKNKNLLVTSRKELDLTNTFKVNEWFSQYKPDIVIIAAAKVGGILVNNNQPVQFLLENLRIQNNLIEASYKFGVKRLLFLGSSCIYPKFAKQPIKEEYLLSDSLEETNQWYAIAKIAGIKLCDAYRQQYNFDAISLMPTNLYGPKDNFDIDSSHVMASLIRKFFEAKFHKHEKVLCWGTGEPLREFLYVEDFAEACIFTLKNWFPRQKNSPKEMNGKSLTRLNIGSNFEITIKELAEKISNIIGYEGQIIWDETKPNGTPRKKLDISHIESLGWSPKTDLDSGIKKSLDYYQKIFFDNNQFENPKKHFQ